MIENKSLFHKAVHFLCQKLEGKILLQEQKFILIDGEEKELIFNDKIEVIRYAKKEGYLCGEILTNR